MGERGGAPDLHCEPMKFRFSFFEPFFWANPKMPTHSTLYTPDPRQNNVNTVTGKINVNTVSDTVSTFLA